MNEKNSISKGHHIKLCIKEYESAQNWFRQNEVKLSKLCSDHTRLTHRHLMSKSDLQPTCGN